MVITNKTDQEVEDMKVYEALQLVIKALEDSATCGRLGEQLRTAKLTLYQYVTQKLAEDIERAEQEEKKEKE